MPAAGTTVIYTSHYMEESKRSAKRSPSSTRASPREGTLNDICAARNLRSNCISASAAGRHRHPYQAVAENT